MTQLPIDSERDHQAFIESERKHVLMITNHGIHQWQIIPGLPDTGGQNVFVNQFTAALAKRDFKITIANRGGYPHPATGEPRRGLSYKDDQQRILYLEDCVHEFVRKEDMIEQIMELTDFLDDFLQAEGDQIDLIVSHYWDGAKVGVEYNKRQANPITHVWVPHSLGAVKKRNVAEERWEDLRIDERITQEEGLIPELDGVAATSDTIRDSLLNDYHCPVDLLFLPPSIDTERYHPRDISAEDDVWDFLSEHCGLSPAEIRQRKIITEISRTDSTKRKNVLIEAFAQVHQEVPDSLLLISIDEYAGELAEELKQLIEDQEIGEHVAVVGNVFEILPTLYAVSSVYCTPSVMEGFGMSVQEAAATKVPVVASHLVPFVTEYLLGDETQEISLNSEHQSLKKGAGAIVVEADDTESFAKALTMLLKNDELRCEMGENAYHITIPYFTWSRMVRDFLDAVGMPTS